jgi:hypothetical protein
MFISVSVLRHTRRCLFLRRRPSLSPSVCSRVGESYILSPPPLLRRCVFSDSPSPTSSVPVDLCVLHCTLMHILQNLLVSTHILACAASVVFSFAPTVRRRRYSVSPSVVILRQPTSLLSPVLPSCPAERTASAQGFFLLRPASPRNTLFPVTCPPVSVPLSISAYPPCRSLRPRRVGISCSSVTLCAFSVVSSSVSASDRPPCAPSVSLCPPVSASPSVSRHPMTLHRRHDRSVCLPGAPYRSTSLSLPCARRRCGGRQCGCYDDAMTRTVVHLSRRRARVVSAAVVGAGAKMIPSVCHPDESACAARTSLASPCARASPSRLRVAEHVCPPWKARSPSCRRSGEHVRLAEHAAADCAPSSDSLSPSLAILRQPTSLLMYVHESMSA